MDAIKIDLKLSGSDYRNLALADGNKSFFTYAPARKYFRYCLLLICLIIVMGFVSNAQLGLAWTLVLLTLAFLAVCIVLITLYSRFASFYKQVDDYAKELDKNPEGSIELHDKYIHYTHGSTFIEKFSDINGLILNEAYIQFRGAENRYYLWQKSSMLPEQFEQVKEWMKQKCA